MSTKFFEQITRSVTYVLLFLLPIVFLPWSQDVLEPNKQIVLVVLTVVGLVAWFGSMVSQKRCEFRSGLVNSLPLIFLFFVLISSFFSKANYQSWVGQSSQEYASFLSTAIFVCIFYLFVNVHKDVVAQRRSLVALLLSASIAGIFSVLQFFRVFSLPFAFAKSASFNTVGTMGGLTVFLLVTLFIGLALWLVSHEGSDRVISSGVAGMLTRALIFVVFVSTLVSLVALDYWAFWVLTIVGVLLLTSFGFLQTKEFPSPRKFVLPLLLLFVSLFFLFLPSPVSFHLPVLVAPSFGTSSQVAKSTLVENVPSLFFGAGPGTFSYQYQLFKPMSINSSSLWSHVFDRGTSAFLTRFSDIGLLGMLAWLVCMGWIGCLAIKRLVSARDHQTWKMTYVLFVGWSLLLVAQFLSSSNLTLEFLLWAMSGMLVAHLLSGVWHVNFARSPKLGLLASFLFVFVFIGMFAAIFLMGEKFLAEKAFTNAVALDAKQGQTQNVIQHLATATKFNRLSDVYARNLSFALLSHASQKMRAVGTEKLTAEQTKEISQIVSASMQEGVRAASLEPNKVGNWQLLGAMYRETMSFVQNGEDLAANAFANTMRLEPINPAHSVDLARVYLAVADRAHTLKASKDPEQAKAAAEQEQKLLASAEQALNQAIKLKGDYLPAHYYLAATYEREGKIAQATARLVALTKNTPSDIGLGFELAQMYLRAKKYDAAKQELERLIKINPDYSNGLWYLASIYEIQKNPQKSIELVQKVVELNPENKVAQERLRKLQAGEVTTTIPEPIQPQPNAVGADASQTTVLKAQSKK
ncbi:hypothetical protein A3C09_03455 [Candidatus Uhrbacteria bacterium RIFCSPHIGHO2_02_FULL_47_44]|uniref:Tetratricopeptide repeat-like domain-containing protein n=1 Tax=Candidatus Uhrbacteria bacterium RIFCSPLOWO2_02_FULL_48_18 TaxID=1802408 RepID=A0A1F7V6R3_9BACT|nr:MAG: hypothetical protein A2839_05040 [Candidatus Uhrbacteria bacterium RIFCSPHIGHO2_01_FULL_47_10]OGL71269.1 MAG: hypothetical protein A3C09_03455 [Candidatus Uhrbacteria bacterium RIFCSPHIGHO2_02_FULL_47_44]OGL76083.1 MAG: hypothetical protein A3E97_02285 [Candidatus Uhrbacteria bacterium RIFCSPHIGHO2_12_FULL_47_12]OGL80363.1 MAG: hypothetical protein A3B20_02995 [Candidatus Uhrbacteria bacterium RIFCSPLOWO2_01_FULL_47_17]OGL86222.1 MAG: hypothetical protein A3I41_01485 [Candidatus Uhrbact